MTGGVQGSVSEHTARCAADDEGGWLSCGARPGSELSDVLEADPQVHKSALIPA
jgi:hypothetical protein